MKPLISLGTLIDTSFEHYKKHLPSILGLTLWLLVAAIPSAIGILLSQEGNAVNTVTWLSFGLNVLGGIIGVLASLHISVALISSLREQKQGKATDPRTFLKKAFSLDLPYLWAIILRGVFVALLPLIPLILSLTAFVFVLRSQNAVLVNIFSVITFAAILLALGGIVKFSLHFAFVPFATVLDGARGMGSLKTSAALVKGRWWETFARIFIPKLLYTVIFVIILVLTLWGTGTLGIALSQGSFFVAKLFAITNFFISTLLNAFFIPLLLLNDYYVYEDLKETK